MRTRTLAGNQASEKIKQRADLGTDLEEQVSNPDDVDLDRDELEVVARVLVVERYPEELPAFANLRDEIFKALGAMPARLEPLDPMRPALMSGTYFVEPDALAFVSADGATSDEIEEAKARGYAHMTKDELIAEVERRG
jgi:hypothetical protein